MGPRPLASIIVTIPGTWFFLILTSLLSSLLKKLFNPLVNVLFPQNHVKQFGHTQQAAHVTQERMQILP
jgi:hypothetical protein